MYKFIPGVFFSPFAALTGHGKRIRFPFSFHGNRAALGADNTGDDFFRHIIPPSH
jgi:hypothetical protein